MIMQNVKIQVNTKCKKQIVSSLFQSLHFGNKGKIIITYMFKKLFLLNTPTHLF